MSEQTVSIGAEDIIELERVGGDVRVEGWDRQELRARGDVLRVERRTESMVVSCAGDLALSIPRSARITLGNIGGDLELADLAGSIELNLVGGDATLRNLTGPVRLRGMIGGEVHLENVADLSMNSPKAGERFHSAERVRRKVEQATRRVDVKLRGAEHRRLRISQMWGQPDNGGSRSQNTAEPEDGPSDEERMAILRMLQDRKITSEQAEKLLAALEGNA